MKKIRFASFLLFFLYACGNGDNSAATTAAPEDDLDAARSFIRATLDGNLDAARKLLELDSTNEQYFNVFERNYRKLPQETQRGYRESSIIIHDNTRLNDSTTIVTYSNTFMNNPDTLRILRHNSNWKVDLKYLFEHDQDSTGAKPVIPAPAGSVKKNSPPAKDSLNK